MADAPAFAARALLWLQLLALAAGALQFAFVPAAVERPFLAAFALVLLTASILLSRALPFLRRSLPRQHCVDIVALIVCITALAAATGAARSALVSLYLVPLAGIALAFGRWWLVLALAAVVAALGFGLGALARDIDFGGRRFALHLLGALAPATAVALVLATLVERMHGAARRITDLASRDALTGLLNLSAFEAALQQEHSKAERFGRCYTLVVIDVDDLAEVNEVLGHEAGSQVLGAVASAVTRSVRSSDVAARLGGDEFIVLLVEADAATGAAIAQRIRNNVYAGTVSVANRLIRANVSVGTASFPADRRDPKELMILADRRMQQDRELRALPQERSS